MNAYNEGLIDAPIITYASSVLSLSIGGLDTKNCNNWAHYNQQAGPWTLTTKSMELLGYKHENAITVSRRFST
jgi:hypothetical protein